MARAAAPSQAQTLLTRRGAQAAWWATVAGGPRLPGSQSPALQTHPLPRAGAGAPRRQSEEQGLLAGEEKETEALRSGSHLRKCRRFNKQDSVFYRSRLETKSTRRPREQTARPGWQGLSSTGRLTSTGPAYGAPRGLWDLPAP